MPVTRHLSAPRTLHSVLGTQHYFLGVLCASVVILLLAACQPQQTTPQELPTLAVLPSITPSSAPTATSTLTDTPQPSLTPKPSIIPTLTETMTPTREPRPTATLEPSVEPTQAAGGTATERVAEAATFVTFTPPPAGTPAAAGTPEQFAVVRVTESQFQKEINQEIGSYPTMQSALVNFVPGGISVQLTALGGQALITGKVFLSVQVSGGIAAISPTDIQVNALEPPEAYVNVVNGDFFVMMVQVLDTILKTRLGPQQNLEDIVINNDEMRLTVRVPQ